MLLGLCEFPASVVARPTSLESMASSFDRLDPSPPSFAGFDGRAVRRGLGAAGCEGKNWLGSDSAIVIAPDGDPLLRCAQVQAPERPSTRLQPRWKRLSMGIVRGCCREERKRNVSLEVVGCVVVRFGCCMDQVVMPRSGNRRQSSRYKGQSKTVLAETETVVFQGAARADHHE